MVLAAPLERWPRNVTAASGLERHAPTIPARDEGLARDGIVGQNKPGLVGRVDDRFRKGRRLIYVGDDQDGTPLEVIAVKLESGELKVIHAIKLRRKAMGIYWEAGHGI